MTRDNTDWLTPRPIIAAVESVLGGIDLDPAACHLKPNWVPAKTRWTKDQDALSREWHGRVFLNPPYARGQISAFAKKFLFEYDALLALRNPSC